MNTRVSDLPDIGTLDGSEYIPVISGVRSYKATISQIGSTGVSGVSSVNTRTGAVVLSKSDVGLENVDNTTDINKPVSTAMQTALNGKVATNDPRLSDARMPTEHTHGQSEVTGLVDALEAKADLVDGVVPASQLPSYVDDILEYDTFAGFPATGEAGKIYVAKDTNLTYRWSGSTYVEISASLALGETSSTAYRGDRGAIAYAHSLVTGNPHGTAMSDISGLVSTLEAKLDASGYTAADVLAKLLTVDTNTAGINATTLKSVTPGSAGLFIMALEALSNSPSIMDGSAVTPSSNIPARQDHVHPSDTSRLAASGNALTASKASQQIVGTCSTAQATIAKEVTLANFTLVEGVRFSVLFTNGPVNGATLNVNGTGAKYLYYNGDGNLETNAIWGSGDIVEIGYFGGRYSIASVCYQSAMSYTPNIVCSSAKIAYDCFTIAGTTPGTTGLGLLASATSLAARTTLELGGASLLDVGTTSGTVCAGDDSRITDALARPPDGAILQISGDNTPEIPDAASGTAIRLSDFTSAPGGWGSNNSPVSSFSGGIWGWSWVAQGTGYYRTNCVGLCVVRCRVPIGGTFSFGFEGVNQRDFPGTGEWVNYTSYSNSTATVVVYITSGSIEISDIYIGTGLYSTPTIDESDNGDHLTNTAVVPTYDSTLGKKVLAFNGVTSYLKTADIQTMPDIVTIDWYGSVPLDTSEIQILASYGPSTAGFRFNIMKDTNTEHCLIEYDPSSSILIESLLPHSTFTRLQFQFNWITGELVIYRNGALFGTYSTKSGMTKPTGGRWYFGNQGLLYETQACGGYLASASIYPRALDISEIRRLYRYGSPYPLYTLTDWRIAKKIFSRALIDTALSTLFSELSSIPLGKYRASGQIYTASTAMIISYIDVTIDGIILYYMSGSSTGSLTITSSTTQVGKWSVSTGIV